MTADPTHRAGQPAGQLSGKKLLWACWCAGLAIGRDQDPLPYLEALGDERDPALEPRAVAQNIFAAVPLPRGRPLSDWHLLWQSHEAPINRFLEALEAHSTTAGLARRARILLQRSILEHAATVRPLTIGTIHAVRTEVTEPIADILPPASAERLHVTVELEGQSMGVLELPVCDGRVSSGVLRDAISAQFAWPVLGRYFERTVYPHLRIVPEPTGLALFRGTVPLAAQLAEGPQFWTCVYDQIGWAIFLQELWARPDWPQHVFYNPQAKDKLKKSERRAAGDWITVEVSEELADLAVSGNAINVVLTVGGAAIGVLAVPAQSRKIAAQTLRAALTLESGFELCRAAVREGLLGRPLAEGGGLRERLADAAATRRQQDTSALTAAVPDLAAGSGRAVGQLLRPGERATLLGCRAQEAIGTSASRWAQLPSGTAAELTAAARSAGEPVIDMPGSDGPPRHVLYTPDLILCAAGQRQAPTPAASSSGAREKDARLYDRNHFEGLFASKVDYWDYTNAYEQTKYEQTLSLLPPGRIGRALELACAEGHFTAQLAPRVDRLIAADFSQIALARAMQRCAEFKQVQFRHLDLLKDPLPDHLDLIVCSEMLYYMDTRQTLATIARKFVRALGPGGYLLTAHPNLVVDEPDKPGFDWDHPFGAKVIGETLANAGGLRLLKELHTPLYRIQLFQRQSRWHLCWIREAPEVVELAQPVAPPPEVAKSALWSGGSPRRGSAKISICTERLPILRYHRVAPAGSANTSPGHVTPEAFETHLRYLRDAGFYGATLEQWRQAMAKKKPLPGRAVLMTFDAGLLDFVTYAWPKMKHYGFSATMFLAADHIGRSRRRDAVYGEELPLLGWEHIRQLQAEGVEFGSLSASQRPLTALPLAEIVREGVHSRRILQEALGVSIRAFAYPYSDLDPVVEHLVGACGYAFGLSCRPGRSCFQDSLLALPRIAIEGADDLQAFVTKLTA